MMQSQHMHENVSQFFFFFLFMLYAFNTLELSFAKK